MTRRQALASAAALCGLGAVKAKAAAPAWRWCDRLVTGWVVEVIEANGDISHSFQGTSRADYDAATKLVQEKWPLDGARVHCDKLLFAR